MHARLHCLVHQGKSGGYNRILAGCGLIVFLTWAFQDLSLSIRRGAIGAFLDSKQGSRSAGKS